MLVGVKAAKDNAPQKEVGDLLQEMMIMQQVGPHPNVVTLLGVCVEQGENEGVSKGQKNSRQLSVVDSFLETWVLVKTRDASNVIQALLGIPVRKIT